MRGFPTVMGRAGKAWKVSVGYDPKTDPPDWSGCLAQWQVNATCYHPMWSWWLVQLIHLRPIAGVKDPVIRLPGATHELVICSLDPDKRVLDPDEKPSDDEKRYHILTPIDVEEQMAGLDDDGAVKVCELAVRAIVNGHISPDQDYRAMWREMLKNTVEHVMLGDHPKKERH